MRFHLQPPAPNISAGDANGANCGTDTAVTRYAPAPARAGNTLVWNSPALPYATHTLRFRITGLADHYSSNTYVTIDRITTVADANLLLPY